MKLTTITIGSALAIVAAGCATHQNGQSGYGYNQSEYGSPEYSQPIGTTAYATPTESAEQTQNAGGSADQSAQSTVHSYYSQATNALGNAWNSIASNGGATSSSNQVSQAYQQLSNDASLAGVLPNIRIGTTNGQLRLTGTVNNEQQKQQIESILQNTTGASNVVNDLQVNGQSGQNGMASATNSIQSSQSGEQMTPTSRPGETNQVFQQNEENQENGQTEQNEQNGQLSPTSRESNQSTSEYQSQSSNGQGSLIQLNVQGASASDQSLGQQIREELRTGTAIQTLKSPIQVKVNSGTVTLQGSVQSQQQKQQIENAIQRVTGVTRVNNQLQVAGNSAQ